MYGIDSCCPCPCPKWMGDRSSGIADRNPNSGKREMNSSSFSVNGSFLIFSPLSNPRLGLRSKQGMSIRRSGHPTFRALAKANGLPGKGRSSSEVIMVDPLEAKQLAVKQLQEIKAKEKFKRQRRIEAINGAWAMIGLTAGLVIEGHTGNGILAQLAGYWNAITSFFWW